MANILHSAIYFKTYMDYQLSLVVAMDTLTSLLLLTFLTALSHSRNVVNHGSSGNRSWENTQLLMVIMTFLWGLGLC